MAEQHHDRNLGCGRKGKGDSHVLCVSADMHDDLKKISPAGMRAVHQKRAANAQQNQRPVALGEFEEASRSCFRFRAVRN